MLRSRLGAVFVVLAVAIGVFPATAFLRPAAADTLTAVPDTAADTSTAVRFAELGRKAVQVTGATTETAETVANPDGTLTTTNHVRPVRVRKNGSWVAPDSTLVAQPGALAPRAATTDVHLARARAADTAPPDGQPLVELTRDGTSVGLDWVGSLPEPTVDGSMATYADVLPGVDLRVEVDVDTIHEVVVVKTAEAAKNPELASLDFSVPVENGSVTKDADGTLHAKDLHGAEKFTAQPAVMWDSSGVGVGDVDLVRGPAPGGRQAGVGEDLAGSKLTLAPDQALLNGSDTAYPVFIDPTWHDNFCGPCVRNHYLVQYACGSGKTPGDAVWDSDDSLHVGYVNDPNSTCDGTNLVTARSYVEMSLAGMAGKKIYDAKLSLSLAQPGSCTANNNIVWAGAIHSGLRFGSGPQSLQTIATVGGCPTNVSYNITSTIASAVGGNASTWTFGILSPNEGDQATWKRYSTQVGFAITYNSQPNQPANLALFNGSQAFSCVQGANRPVVGPTSTGYITRANVSDPDGATLYAGFRVYNGLVSTQNYHWDGREFGVDNVISDANKNNRNAAVTLPLTEMNADGFYSWDVHSTDGRETSWSVPCEVEVELSPPAAPTVSSQTYPRGGFGGGPSRPGDFTFTVANSPTTVDHYVWRLDSTVSPLCDGVEPGTVKPAAFNGPGTSTITPGMSGPHVLSVWSCNRAKTPSSRADYSFSVKDATAPVASWQLEGDGTSAVPGLRYAGAGVPNFTTGKVGQAASLSGQTGDVFETSAGVVDTSKSFSVSAWANAGELGTSTRTVVAQEGSQTDGFALEYLPSGQWAFALSSADTSSPAVTIATSTATAQTGSWTHLTGVYDASAHTATLYVGGQAQQTVSVSEPSFGGAFVIGAGKFAGARTTPFKGSIDEVSAFAHALSAAEVGTLFGNNGIPTGLTAVREYQLEGNTADSTDTDGRLTTSGASPFGAGYSDTSGQSATEDSVGHTTGQGLVFPDAGSVQTSGPVVDTSQSFTVSAWVKPADGGDHALVVQESTHANGFALTMSADHWGAGVAAADADGSASNIRWAVSPTAPSTGQWTHLTAVYDAGAGKELLYVNGQLSVQTAVPAGTVIRSAGPLSIGKANPGGQVATAYSGSIDQAQVWDRPLQAPEVAGLANTPVLRADYQLAGSADDSVTGAAGTVSGGASLTTDDDGVDVARFGHNTGGQIEGPRPVNLHSDRSFTVEAWVRHTWTQADADAEKLVDPTDTAGIDRPGRAAVGVNSSVFSPYMLGYRGVKDASGVWRPRWSWLMTDQRATPADAAAWYAIPDVDAQDNVWTHLTGTYDAVSHTACLYATTDAFQYPTTCTSNVVGIDGASDLEDLFLGRGRWQGQDSDYWYGDIRGVRIYTGVLDTQHINADAIVDHP